MAALGVKVMARTLHISDAGQVGIHLSKIAASSARGLSAISALSDQSDPVAALASLKFSQVGCDPLDPDRALNVIEQLNQTFTYLATLKATEHLYRLFPGCSGFTLKMGALAGTDIESGDFGGIAAEVFAAVTPSNNNKLNKDIAKVAGSEAAHKYVFFMCPGVEEGERPSHAGYPEVKVFSLGAYRSDT